MVGIGVADRRRRAAAEPLAAAERTRPGNLIPDIAGALHSAVPPKAAEHLTWAEETSTGRRRNLTHEKDEAFWEFAAIEVLRLTGIGTEHRAPTPTALHQLLINALATMDLTDVGGEPLASTHTTSAESS